MNVGVEFLYRPPSLRSAIASVFVGGGAGIRTARIETTCVLGDCSGDYSALIQEDRWHHSYFGFVTGVDVRIVYGFVARGVLRVDSFPSESGTMQFGIELGYRLGAR